jgi:predicted nucleic acid-binding protein
MFLDSAYIAKFYLNERDSLAVRKKAQGADVLISSAWSIGEVTCAFHRHLRQGELNPSQFHELLRAFLGHVDGGVWTLVPVTEPLLRRMSLQMTSLPAGVFLRTGDAIQLASAQEVGEREVWTSDRHMLAAAPHFGLIGRTA